MQEYIEWAKGVARKYESSFYMLYCSETANKVDHFTNLVIDWNGTDSYTNKVDWETHLGVRGVAERYKDFIKNDEIQLLKRLEFTIKHEVCHLRFTSGQSYKIAVRRGSQQVYKMIASNVAGKPVSFRNESDFKRWKNRIREAGIYIPENSIESIAASIANSICDGRIERIRSGSDKRFAKERLLFRGENWEASEMEYPDFSELSSKPALKLQVMMNQILSLAKLQALQKGFLEAYGDTPLIREVSAIYPAILEGYLARSTRGMGEACVKICDKLADLIYDAVKMSAEDVAQMQALENMLRQLLSMIAASADYGNVDTNAEEDDLEGMERFNTALPFSNLVITLPDDEYDKLMKKAKKGEGDENTIQIRREHPLPEEEKKDGNNSSSDSSQESGQNSDSSDGNGSNSEKENESKDSSGQGGDSSESDSKDKEGNNPSENQASNSTGQSSSERTSSSAGKKNDDSDSSDSNDSSSEEENGSKGSSKQSGNSSESDSKEIASIAGKKNSKSEHSNSGETEDSDENASNSKGSPDQESNQSSDESGNADDSVATQKNGRQKFSGTPEEDSLRRAMEEAARSVNASIRSEVDNVNSMILAQNSLAVTKKETGTPKPIKPVTPEEVMDICSNFRELRRSYELDVDLPADLRMRADALKQDTEDYFEHFRQPDIRFMTEGEFDIEQIALLARKDTDVFMMEGNAEEVDCCYYILLDNSGSTGGKDGAKRKAECRAAAIQEEAYKDIFPMKIVAFDADGQGVIHEVIKDWEESPVENCCINFGAYGRDGYGNEDNFDIAIAARELMSRPERNKMLIVLSDGAPGDIHATRQAIEDAREMGIKVIGIYFERGEIIEEPEAFVYMYQTDYIVCSMYEIDAHLSEVIKSFSRK